MFATLAVTLLIGKPAPMMSPEVVAKLSIASQGYGGPPVPVSQLSRGTGFYMSPSDDIWVYAHASDPQKDEFIRAWGANGRSIPIPGDDPASSSWSLLKWDLSGFSDKAKIVEAQLIFHAAPGAGYTTTDAQAAPLEARPVKSNFNETRWDYADSGEFAPIGTEGETFGESAPPEVNPNGFKIVIDLIRGPVDFKEYFNKAIKKDKTFAIAISSRIDPSTLGREGIYKVYSKDATDPMLRPVLRLVLETKN
jgi:hypothetical protein